MEVSLNVIDRLHLCDILVKHGPGNLVTMRMVAGLKTRFGISPEEIDGLGIKQEEVGVSIKKNESRKFDLTTAEEVFLKGLLQKRSSGNNVSIDELPLYDAFGITE